MIRPIRIAALSLIVSVSLLLTGCTNDPTVEEPQLTDWEIIAAKHDLGGLDAEAAISKLEATTLQQRSDTLLARVQPEALVLTDTVTGQRASLPLPTDRFYLSMAPYVRQTHECVLHSLTTCVGELRGETISVQVVSNDDKIIVDQTSVINDNGFIGVWLPRNITATVVVNYAGKSASTAVSTAGDAPTCLTTLQLT